MKRKVIVNEKNNSHKVGVTSWVFCNMDIFEIADLLGQNDLGIEIHLNDFDMELGTPDPFVQGGVWPRTFDEQKRKKLKEVVAKMPVVTVHGTPYDINVAANNPALREESIRQYEEAMDLARDIGSDTVTYHPGKPSGRMVPESILIDRHVEFAKRISRRAENYGIRTGFENQDKDDDFEFMANIRRQVDSPNWGHLLDIGQAIMGRRGDTTGMSSGASDVVLEWIDALGVDKIAQIHAHNVLGWSCVPAAMLQHRAFEDGNCLDMEVIFGKLRDIGFDGPIILEILENTPEKIIESSIRARDTIREIMGK
jgi:sugar phosphate isomerase/epimerase